MKENKEDLEPLDNLLKDSKGDNIFLDCIDKIDIANDLNVKVDSFSWGNNSNLIVFCTDLKSKNRFSFSVWKTNGYSCRSGEYNFKNLKDNYSEEKSYLTLKLIKTKKGHLDCKNAKTTSDVTLELLNEFYTLSLKNMNNINIYNTIVDSNLRMLNLGDKDLYDEKELLGCLLNSCWETIHLLNNNVKVENVEKTLLNIENTSLALFPDNKFFKSK